MTDDELIQILETECGHSIGDVLSQKSPDLFAALMTLLAPDAAVSALHRQRALHLVGRWGDPAAVPAIRRLLPHLEARERLVAVDALGRIGTADALDGVLEHVEDPSPDVRRFVVSALRRIGTPPARARLNELARHDPTDFVRDRAAKALSSLGR
jgi:HEAT repeat protein